MDQAFGGVELGGTKIVCAVGRGPNDVDALDTFPTGDPQASIARLLDFFRSAARPGRPLAAVGVASFGPLERRPGHPSFGRLLATPKPGWSGADVVGPLARGLGLPVAFDTDVRGAAVGEWRWGAACDVDVMVYVTVGTGIGGALLVRGVPPATLGHPEVGHVSVSRAPGDVFPGACPFHGDCLEGLASGPAIAGRTGTPAETLTAGALDAARALEAGYLADGLRTIVYTLSPARIVLGGGVLQMPGLLEAVRERLADALGGYPGLPEHAAREFIVPPALGARAGVLGALVLAERRLSGSQALA